MNSVNKINTPSAPGIPNHWQLKKLGEVGEIISGGTPSTKVAAYWNGTISWITPADLSCYDKKIITKGRKSITVIGLKNSSSRLLPKGSILFSSRAPIGYVAIAGNEVCTNQGFKSIIPDKSILSEYLFYFLKASKQNAEKVASGTTFKEISMKAFSQLEIPLPPLPEQQAIVAKIEELFSELDKGVESLKTAQQQLKVYRQSLLKWAFEGKLTKSEFRSEKAELAVAAEGKEKYGNTNLPEGWKWVKLSEITEVKDGTHDTPKYISEGIPFITQKNIKDSGLSFSNVQFIAKSDHDKFYTRSNVSLNDILISMIGANRGMSCIVNDSRVFSIKNVGLIKSNSSKINQMFLLYYLKSSYSKNYIKSLSKGGAQEFIGLTELRNFPIKYCPIKQQQLIVEELESRLTVCDKIEETINNGLQQSEALRQSILKRAFEGRLV